MHSEPEVVLEQAEFFRVLAPDRLLRIRPRITQKRLLPRRVLYVEGAPAEALWAVRRGRVRLYKSSPSGQLTTLEQLGAGEVFGAISALDRPAYSSSAEAVTEGAAWCLPREQFLALVREDPRLAVEILEIVSKRLRDAHDRLRSLARDPAPVRLAVALLQAASNGEAAVTRRALAEAAGTTVETAIRVLRRLEREGLIRSDVGRVTLLDEAALRAVAERPPS